MVKFLINVLEIALILKVMYKGVKWLMFGKKQKGKYSKGKRYKRKSIAGKIVMLVSKRIHYNLDCMIKAQKESLATDVKNQKQDNQQVNSKVVEIKKYKRKANVQ